MARLIETSGASREVKPTEGQYFSLKELQDFVGGMIEIIRVGGRWFVLNEEGKMLGLPVNMIATDLTRGLLADDDLIVGNVLVCSEEELD